MVCNCLLSSKIPRWSFKVRANITPSITVQGVVGCVKGRWRVCNVNCRSLMEYHISAIWTSTLGLNLRIQLTNEHSNCLYFIVVTCQIELNVHRPSFFSFCNKHLLQLITCCLVLLFPTILLTDRQTHTPTNLHTSLPVCQPACLSTYLPTYLPKHACLYSEFIITETRLYFACLLRIVFYADTYLWFSLT